MNVIILKNTFKDQEKYIGNGVKISIKMLANNIKEVLHKIKKKIELQNKINFRKLGD